MLEPETQLGDRRRGRFGRRLRNEGGWWQPNIILLDARLLGVAGGGGDPAVDRVAPRGESADRVDVLDYALSYQSSGGGGWLRHQGRRTLRAFETEHPDGIQRRSGPFPRRSGRTSGTLREKRGPDRDKPLNNAQMEILKLAGQGFSNCEIASYVHLSEGRVPSGSRTSPRAANHDA